MTHHHYRRQYSQSEFYSYDPVKEVGRKETLNASKALRRRYYMVQVAKDAKTVGILAGTLGVADYLQVLSDLKRLCKNAGKKTYTFIMGKLNPAKLANFMEIDCFVLIACRENTLIESKDFYRPIVTPFELELACVKGREWTGEYELDFRRILPKLAEDLAKTDKATANGSGGGVETRGGRTDDSGGETFHAKRAKRARVQANSQTAGVEGRASARGKKAICLSAVRRGIAASRGARLQRSRHPFEASLRRNADENRCGGRVGRCAEGRKTCSGRPFGPRRARRGARDPLGAPFGYRDGLGKPSCERIDAGRAEIGPRRREFPDPPKRARASSRR